MINRRIPRRGTMCVLLLFAVCLLLNACALRRVRAPRERWDDPSLWTMINNPESTGRLYAVQGRDGPILQLDYRLGGGHGWVEITKAVPVPLPADIPVVMTLKTKGGGDLEFKFVDGDGSVFGRKVPLTGQYSNWTRVVIYRENTEYWWGGRDAEFSGLGAFQLAVSRAGRGTLLIDGIGPGVGNMPSSYPPAGPVLDPDRELPGIGFRQRRAAEMIPEDPLVLEWLKQVQDVSSPDRRILPSMENNEAHTFNNALVAMAFLVKGERERAERILDFFANATERANADPTRQNFFLNGEARGFFQAVALNDEGSTRAFHTFRPNDRWMGDLAWLLIACKHHEKLYGPERYAELRRLILDLLVSWYRKADDGIGGYVQHGWRQGDTKLHEGFGHAEGNIDAYAVMRLCGENEMADSIKTWLDAVLRGDSMALDLYTWRALAFGPATVHVLNTPDYDLRYRKTLTVKGKKVAGLYDHPDINVTNSWLDGVGHIACAYLAGGNPERGYFYGNQLDPFLMQRDIGGVMTHAIPYVANRQGYEWVDTSKGFVSVAAWYIFAKNRFNPMTLETY